jgi:hypothetical protein
MAIVGGLIPDCDVVTEANSRALRQAIEQYEATRAGLSAGER